MMRCIGVALEMRYNARSYPRTHPGLVLCIVMTSKVDDKRRGKVSQKVTLTQSN